MVAGTCMVCKGVVGGWGSFRLLDAHMLCTASCIHGWNGRRKFITQLYGVQYRLLAVGGRLLLHQKYCIAEDGDSARDPISKFVDAARVLTNSQTNCLQKSRKIVTTFVERSFEWHN
jgi:hypothetical protein